LELPRLGYNNKVTELNKRFRQLNYYKKVDLFYKSISEIIGLQEVLDEAETRQFSCLCVSPNTEVYYISKQVNLYIGSHVSNTFH
jgi:hypothetical protein